MSADVNKNNDEALIERAIQGLIEAVRARDIEGTMSIYTQDVVSFDIAPPLQFIGADAFRKVWEELFSLFQGPINYENRDLSITAGEDVAFTYSFDRISGTLPNGQELGAWVRWTACFRKINGKWLIVHHHNSVPADFRTGKAVTDLTP